MKEEERQLTERGKMTLLEKLGFTVESVGRSPHRGLFCQNYHGSVLVARQWYGVKEGRYSHTYDYFDLSDLSQCMLMLEGLSKVSGWKWVAETLPCGSKRIYANRTEHPCCPYDKYGEDLCELIRDAVFWWLENGYFDS